jgi:hypothetical protein
MTSCVPVPESATVCGLPPALSETLSDADRLPLAEGVNAITIVQLPKTATEVPQVLFSAKSAGSAPMNVKLEMLKTVPVLFDRVRVCDVLASPTGWFPKLRLLGEKLTLERLFEPLAFTLVPEMDTDCGLVGALSFRVTAAEKVPAPLGANWTPMVQLAPAARLLPQVEVSLKLVGYAPVSQICVMLKVAVPAFVTVRVRTELAVPSTWLPNVRLAGERPTSGVLAPVPERATDCGLLAALSTKVTAAVIDPGLIGANWTLIVHADPAARPVPQLLLSMYWWG